jgi:hypothetical protein
LIISFLPEGKVYRLLTGAAGFLVPTCSLNADLRGFSWLLTAPRGRRYSIGMVRRGDSAPRGEIQHAVEKENSYLYDLS